MKRREPVSDVVAVTASRSVLAEVATLRVSARSMRFAIRDHHVLSRWRRGTLHATTGSSSDPFAATLRRGFTPPDHERDARTATVNLKMMNGCTRKKRVLLHRIDAGFMAPWVHQRYSP